MNRPLRVLIAVATLLGGSACAAGGGETAADSSVSTGPPATLGLTPLEPDGPIDLTTVPSATFDTLPAFEVSTNPGSTSAETTVFDAPTSLDPIALPDPDPPPIPDAHENRNQIGSMEIAALSVRQDLFEGVTLKTLNNGPGHWPGSALPGQAGNLVVAGHRVSHTHPFRDLDKLNKGDEVVFLTAQGRNVYLVTRTEIVTPDALWIVDQTPEKTATLFACHPKGTTDQRIVVFLKYSPERSEPAA